MADDLDPLDALDPLDPLEQRLEGAGRRWRATLPPGPDLVAARSRRARSLRGAAIASVAAVVLVVGGISAGVGVFTHGEHRGLPPIEDSAAVTTPATATSATATSAADAVVPWRPLTATYPTLAASTAPASPGPSEAADTPACGPGDLRLERGQTDGAMGSIYLPVHVLLVGSRPCHLEGYPTVRPLGRGRPLDVAVREESGGRAPEGKAVPVVVRPGQPALLRISWAVAHSCPVVDNDQLELTLPGGAGATIAGFGQSSCNPGEGASAMWVEPVQPFRYVPAHITSPYDAVSASADLDLSVEPGQPLDFTVTLTSKQDLPLAPCPDYVIATDQGEQRYALNCAAVPHRDAQGRPYLPAGVPVRFAMHAGAGTAQQSKLIWQLLTPSGHVAAGGLITRSADR